MTTTDPAANLAGHLSAIDAEVKVYRYAAAALVAAVIDGDALDRADKAASLAACMLDADTYARAVAHWSATNAATRNAEVTA